MRVFIFGNPDLPNDSLPLQILPQLQTSFPKDEFIQSDPNEEWDVLDTVTAIDTVLGIKDVSLFQDLKIFESAPRMTMHDFDALANLRLLHKLGRVKKVRIIGIPPGIGRQEAADKTAKLIEQIKKESG